jgi:hypothetical protein
VRPNEIVDGFGEDEARGTPSVEQDAVEVAQAWYQHRLAQAVRRRLEAHGIADAAFAALIGEQAPATFQRKMRGDVRIRSADLLRWSILLGSDVMPHLVDTLLFPPEHRDWLGGWRPASFTPATLRRPPAGSLPDVNWLNAAAWITRRELLRERSERAHLVDDSVFRSDIVEYLLTCERLPADSIHLDELAHAAGVVVGPPEVGRLVCVWVPDYETNDGRVVDALCRVVVLVHQLAEVRTRIRLAIVSIAKPAIRTLDRWYDGLANTARGMQFTFEQGTTAELATSHQTSRLAELPPYGTTVELLTSKMNGQTQPDRQVAVLSVVGHAGPTGKRLRLA